MQHPIPAEWHQHRRIYTAWPSHPELWTGDTLQSAREQIAEMINVICDTQSVTVLVSGATAHAQAEAMLSATAEIIDLPFGDIWLRDTGPIFDGRGQALRFQHNGWGGKYLLEGDAEVGEMIAQHAAATVIKHDFVLEGGALEHNGEGAILTTRQCLLNANRNHWQQEQAEQILCEVFAANTIYWLDEGLFNDHTDGHIDNLARFVDIKTVLCQSPFGSDDPNAELYRKTQTELESQGLDVVTIPAPGLVKDGNGEIMPASHLNFVICNEVVVVPVYADHVAAALAVGTLKELFPGRRVVAVQARAVLTGGGSFHCITQQEPA